MSALNLGGWPAALALMFSVERQTGTHVCVDCPNLLSLRLKTFFMCVLTNVKQQLQRQQHTERFFALPHASPTLSQRGHVKHPSMEICFPPFSPKPQSQPYHRFCIRIFTSARHLTVTVDDAHAKNIRWDPRGRWTWWCPPCVRASSLAARAGRSPARATAQRRERRRPERPPSPWAPCAAINPTSR